MEAVGWSPLRAPRVPCAMVSAVCPAAIMEGGLEQPLVECTVVLEGGAGWVQVLIFLGHRALYTVGV